MVDVPALEHFQPRALSAFNAAQDRAYEMKKRQALSDIGGSMADGNLSAAADRAYRSGELDVGMKISGMEGDRKTKAIALLAKGAEAADTPEKWAAWAKVAGDYSGTPVDIPFEHRDAVLAEFKQAINAKVVPPGASVVDMNDPAAGPLYSAPPSPDDKPTPYIVNPDGSMSFRPGGPADPSVIKAQSEARGAGTRLRTLPQTTIKALADSGEGVINTNRVVGTFDDKYGGYGAAWTGNLANWLARTTGIGDDDAANWWQDYQRQKNVVRNQLFGSALTATEKGEFERADINPGMKPELIRKNLERQNAAAHRAAKKLAEAYIRQGYSPDVIEGAIGVPLADIGVTPPDDAPEPIPADGGGKDRSQKIIDEFRTAHPGVMFKTEDEAWAAIDAWDRDRKAGGGGTETIEGDVDPQQMIDWANEAIANGADREQVMQRLRDMGIEAE